MTARQFVRWHPYFCFIVFPPGTLAFWVYLRVEKALNVKVPDDFEFEVG